jgi:hypothetical protein
MREDLKEIKKTRPQVLLFLFLCLGAILFGISSIPSGATCRNHALMNTKAELVMLHKAVASYQARFGVYPYSKDYHGDFNFVEQLSKVPVGSKGYSGKKRPMLIAFRRSNMNLTTDDYDDLNGPQTTVLDPYDQAYVFVYEKITDSFYVYSIGVDGVAGTDDDVRSDKIINK